MTQFGGRTSPPQTYPPAKFQENPCMPSIGHPFGNFILSGFFKFPRPKFKKSPAQKSREQKIQRNKGDSASCHEEFP